MGIRLHISFAIEGTNHGINSNTFLSHAGKLHSSTPFTQTVQRLILYILINHQATRLTVFDSRPYPQAPSQTPSRHTFWAQSTAATSPMPSQTALHPRIERLRTNRATETDRAEVLVVD